MTLDMLGPLAYTAGGLYSIQGTHQTLPRTQVLAHVSVKLRLFNICQNMEDSICL